MELVGIYNNNNLDYKIEIVDNDAVGLILNDTRDTNPMSIDNSGAVMNLRYNTTSMLALDGATSNATFAGDVIVPEYIKHSGDEDTSIRFTTNNIKFYTANNEVLELEDDGQVNIISAGTVTNPCLTNSLVCFFNSFVLSFSLITPASIKALLIVSCNTNCIVKANISTINFCAKSFKD